MQPLVRWSCVSLIAVLACGCVPDDRYRQVLDQNEMLQKTNDGLTTDNDRLKGEVDDLKLLGQRSQAEADRERERAVATEVAFKRLSEKTQEVLKDLVKVVPQGGDGSPIEIDPNTGHIRLMDAVLFETGKAEIRKSGEDVLKRLAEALKTEVAKGRYIRIDGHTDNQPIVMNKDTYPTNWHLSGARALNVLLFLQKEGVDPSHLSFVGFGEYRPREANAKGHKGNKKNRRVEIAILD